MVLGFLKNHRTKILIGAPIVFLFFVVNLGSFGTSNNFGFSANKNPFLVTGETFRLAVIANSLSPINAVGGTITFSPDLLEVTSLDTADSIIDLWSEEPSYSNTQGTAHFSGGILEEVGQLKKARVITIELRARQVGKAYVSMQDGMLLAGDGTGANLLSRVEPGVIWIRDPKSPSPDLDGNDILSIKDANILYLRTFRAYDARYDLNMDSKVDWADVRFLSDLMR